MQDVKINPDKISDNDSSVKPFHLRLTEEGLCLVRKKTSTVQINVGYLCNLSCRHCHLEAGPASELIMSEETADQVLDYIDRANFAIADITGGAPELVPFLPDFIRKLSQKVERLILRTNLTAAPPGGYDNFIKLLAELNVVVVASLPSLNKKQTQSQRGAGAFDASIESLKRLNEIGYGVEGSGLQLDLVSNPTGAFMPQAQESAEKKFRKILKSKWGISFTNLYTFANVPLGRFKNWLVDSGNYNSYMQKLSAALNRCTIEGLMCREQVSVSWNGYLYACDFNIAARLGLGGKQTHVTEMTDAPETGSAISCADHCYACTAGAGFT